MARGKAAEVRLEAIDAAKRLHRILNSKESAQSNGGAVDVFGAIEALDIPLVFKPLKSALGLCSPRPLLGIMVTTERSLHIQRFTAAHELGHAVLDHSVSIDRDFNYRAAIGDDQGQHYQEMAADAFAAEFLLPKWLYKYHVQRQRWTVRSHLQNPEIVYQLSLRMGASYEATCWGLLGHEILPRYAVENLVKVRVASIKEAAGAGHRPGHGQANAWRFSINDNNTTVFGNGDDLLRFDLAENAGAGYQWNVDSLERSGFDILEDVNDIPRDPLRYGGSVERVVVARSNAWTRGRISITESQPWLGPTDEDQTLEIDLNFEGSEVDGLSRAARRKRGAVEQ